MVMRILSCTAVDTNEAKSLAIRFFHLLSSCPSSSHSPPPAPCHRPPARQRWLLPSPPPHRLSPLRLGFRYTRSPPSFISWLATSSICAALPFFFLFSSKLAPLLIVFIFLTYTYRWCAQCSIQPQLLSPGKQQASRPFGCARSQVASRPCLVRYVCNITVMFFATSIGICTLLYSHA